MRTIGREAQKPISDQDVLKTKISNLRAENEALKNTVKKLETKLKKAVKDNDAGAQAKTDEKTAE